MSENVDAVISDKVFEKLRQSTTAKKYLEIVESLIIDCNKDEVIQIFRNMLLDHDICCRIVNNGREIEHFYDRIISIINDMKLREGC